MKLFNTMEFNSLDDLYVEQLQDLYDAELRIINALPKMADAASSVDLKRAFEEHLRQTEEHASRLETIFRQMGKEPQRETCEAMQGLIAEGEEMISARGNPDVRDAALVAAAQRVEHYEIAGYGTARTFADRLGHREASSLLQQTLEEEKQTDQRLTRIAEENVNLRAAD